MEKKENNQKEVEKEDENIAAKELEKEKKKADKKIAKLKKTLVDKEKELQLLMEKNEELSSKYLYALAEMRDLHKNYQKDNTNSMGYLKKDMILEILPIYDVFEKVLQNKNVSQEVQAYLRGFELVLNQMTLFFENKGVEKINSTEKSDFDHNVHNAVEKVETDDEKLDGKIELTLQSGYKMDGKLLRPAAVKVYKHTKEGAEQKQEDVKEEKGKKSKEVDKKEKKEEKVIDDKKNKGGDQND